MRLISSMKKMAILLSTLAMPLLLSHCSTHRGIPFPTETHHPDQAVVNTDQVTAVVLKGHMHVDLSTKIHQHHLTFAMPNTDLAKSHIYIAHHTLYIDNSNRDGLPSEYHLSIGRHLRLLSLHGNISVDSTNLQTRSLTVIDASGGQVNLNGQVDVQRIYANQHSHLNIAWVNSPLLVVYANDHAHLNLAGSTKEFYIHLTGDALLKAQYLRANSITIDSTSYATAHLMPLNSFQGFAHQASTVYLYHNPAHKNSHTWEQANIFMKSYRP